jgi:hypothetical protein
MSRPKILLVLLILIFLRIEGCGRDEENEKDSKPGPRLALAENRQQ